LAEYTEGKEGKPVAAFQRELYAFALQAQAHIDKENTFILPLVAEKFSPPEQGGMMQQIISAIPKEAMAQAVPWLVARQTMDDAVAYVNGLAAAMPEPVFQAAKGWIQGGVDAERWAALQERVPQLRG
jgi:hypothetical protein